MRTTLSRAIRALVDGLGTSALSRHMADRSAAAASKSRSRARDARVSVFEPLEGRTLMSTYYISPTGNDSNNGTSISSPWKSIGKVNSASFKAGDSVLFQGGKTFNGTLSFSSHDAGNASTPVTFGSYSGTATISSGGNTGAFVYGISGLWIENLNFKGSPSGGLQSGINMEMYWGTAVNDRISGCTITGYYEAGILVEGTGGSSGVNGLQITNNSINNNVEAGIYTVAANDHSITNIYIANNQVFNNYGDGHSTVTGSGIELGDVNGATVQYNTAYLNGSKGGDGAVGIWAYSSNDVTFQYNESYDNKAFRGHDGDGFDFDADVTNSVIQYNYAFGNDGTGAQLDQWQNNSGFYNDTVRYNVFQDNGRKNNYGNLEVWGRVQNCYLYNNVIYSTPSQSGTNSAIRVHNSTIPGLYVSGVHFINNIIDSDGSNLINIPYSEAIGAQNLTFDGNVYYSNGYTPVFIDGKNTAHSLAQWQSLGQETLNGKKVGLFANPDFVAAGTAGVVNVSGLPSITQYELKSGSPVFAQSMNLTAQFGIATPATDFYGTKLASNEALVAGVEQK
jgi:hypothetical protein